MKATLYMAMSADGYIARKNGDEDFLSDEQRQESLKFAKPF
jgi:riboflavin biosynthesis pyrimidine reductase